MLKYFMSGIDKFFSHSGDFLKPVVFNLCVGEDYDIKKDSKIKRVEKHEIRCLMLERTEQNKDTAGLKQKELTLVCRLKDFKKVPEISDFFTIGNRVYNILEIVNDNGLYLSIKGQ